MEMWSRPGDRGSGNRVEESPDSLGQSAGEIPGGATRGKCHRNKPPPTSVGGKGEKVR
jgi:hypothetical protein